MIDGIKILDLSVSADALLQHKGLLFALPVDEKEAEVLTERSRRSADRGLVFTLIPSITGKRLRCELKGSLHRFFNGGLHNANAFTVADLLAALNELVSTYCINPFLSRLNNLEFGVNVELPFPVSRVLENLISYKYRAFQRQTDDGFTYYQCQTQRYVVKLYDKGQQYNLTDHVLRFEIKVLKMEYLTRRGVQLDCLADLLKSLNYGTLGTLLVETFSEILFDEPTINPDQLTVRGREVYLNGRNPRFWTIPDPLTDQQYERHRKGLQRTEGRFRHLLARHRQGVDWPGLTADLIRQTWQGLTVVDAELQELIHHQLHLWRRSSPEAVIESTDRKSTETCPKLTGLNATVEEPTCPILTDPSSTLPEEKCPKLTDFSMTSPERETPTVSTQKCPKLTGSEKGEMSQINPLDVVLIWDKLPTGTPTTNSPRETVETAAVLTHGAVGENHSASSASALFFERVSAPQLSLSDAGQQSSSTSSQSLSSTGSPRLTASALRADERLLTTVERGRRRYAKGSKEEAHERAAHNLRNDETNPRNNLARRLRRLEQTPGLFPVEEVVRLTNEQRALLEPWQGSAYEIHLLTQRQAPG